MMKKQEDGTKIYVNRWPAWMDLEEFLYRPLLTRILPSVCGFFCGILDQFFGVCAKVAVAAGSMVAGVLNIVTDGVVVVLRKTVYRDSMDRGELEEGNEMTHAVGASLNKLEALLNKTVWRKHEHRKDLEHWFVLKYAAFKENATVIERSLSFGLVLFSIGLCATLIYLLITALW